MSKKRKKMQEMNPAADEWNLNNDSRFENVNGAMDPSGPSGPIVREVTFTRHAAIDDFVENPKKAEMRMLNAEKVFTPREPPRQTPISVRLGASNNSESSFRPIAEPLDLSRIKPKKVEVVEYRNTFPFDIGVNFIGLGESVNEEHTNSGQTANFILHGAQKDSKLVGKVIFDESHVRATSGEFEGYDLESIKRGIKSVKHSISETRDGKTHTRSEENYFVDSPYHPLYEQQEEIFMENARRNSEPHYPVEATNEGYPIDQNVYKEYMPKIEAKLKNDNPANLKNFKLCCFPITEAKDHKDHKNEKKNVNASAQMQNGKDHKKVNSQFAKNFGSAKTNDKDERNTQTENLWVNVAASKQIFLGHSKANQTEMPRKSINQKTELISVKLRITV